MAATMEISQPFAGRRRGRDDSDDDENRKRFRGFPERFEKKTNYPNNLRAILVALVRQSLIDLIQHDMFVAPDLLPLLEARAIAADAQGIAAEPVIFDGSPIVNIIRDIGQQRIGGQVMWNTCEYVHQRVFNLPEGQARNMLRMTFAPHLEHGSDEAAVLRVLQILLMSEMLAAEAAREGLAERAIAIIEWTLEMLNQSPVPQWIQSQGGWVEYLRNLRS